MARQPDTSAAEVLQRIGGATVERDRGEADRVLIRGAESRLVSTTLDGERLASTEGDARTAGIGLVPASLLEAVRVSKTFTPDMDGDAIGGVVDLVTRKAPAGGLRELDSSGGWDGQSEGWLRAGSVALADRFVDDRLGLLFSGSVQNAERGADRLDARYDGKSVERLELRDYALTRDRRGFSGALDFAPSESSELFAKGFFSSLTTDEERRRAKFDLGDSEIERELKDSRLEQEVISLTAGGHQLLRGKVLVDYKIGAQRAAQHEPFRVDTSFIQEDVAFSPDGLQPTPTNEDVSLFRLDKVGVENNETEEENLFGSIDLSTPIRVQDRDRGIFRTGVKLRGKTKRQDTDTSIFESDRDLFLADFLDRSFFGRGFLDGRHDLGPVVDRDQARDLIEGFGLMGSLSLEEEAADYRATETTAGAYAMAELTLGSRWTLLPGVRYEQTRSDYRGFEVLASGSPDDAPIRDLAGEQSYGKWLPGIHAAYAARENLILRGAVTRTLARPDYFDLVPFRLFDFEDAELELGNSELRPTTSWNFDLGVDWFAGRSTEASLSLFQKSIDDFIFTRRTTSEIAGDLFYVTRPTNGERAELQGIEVSFRHRLDANAGLLEGFAIELHYTGTRSSARIDELESNRFRLPGQAWNSGQLLIGYDRGPVFSSLTATYVGDYLLELGGNREEDVLFDRQLRFDVAAGFSITEWAQIYMHLNNLTDEPLRMYQGSPDRLYRLEYTGRSARIGFKLRF